MGIRQTDALIKTTIDLVLKEMRENDWLLEDVFGDMIEDDYMKELYGQKEIDRVREWLLNTKIPVLLRFRNDVQEFPCITIALGEDNEDDQQATLADQTTDSVELSPNRIKKPIPYIIKPFVPVSFDPATGLLEIPIDLDISSIAPKMKAINPETGESFEILDFAGTNGILLKNATNFQTSKVGIVPENIKWHARIEDANFRQNYTIGCHVSGDPAELMWLHSIVLYGILRYRETLLEARDFRISSVRSSDFSRNPQLQIENAFSRWITLTGLACHSWIKSPKRYIEKIKIQDGGVKYLTNEDTPIETQNPTEINPWETIPQSPQQSKKKIIRRN